MKNRDKKSGFPAIYPISPDFLGGKALLEWADELVREGCRFIQFRRKYGSDADTLKDLRALVALCHGSECRVIVDDRPDLCLIAAADGVHLGRDDIPPIPARQLLGPDAVIGVSSHNEKQFHEALEMPVDYVALGPVFPTKSKIDAEKPVHEDIQKALVSEAILPVVAIGGITPEKAAELYSMGFASVAAIGAFEKEPAEAWKAFGTVNGGGWH